MQTASSDGPEFLRLLSLSEPLPDIRAAFSQKPQKAATKGHVSIRPAREGMDHAKGTVLAGPFPIGEAPEKAFRGGGGLSHKLN